MSSYEDITHLSQREQVRLRTGMWLGDVNSGEYDSALMNMVREVVSNSVDDFMNGGATEIRVTVSPELDSVSIMDNGRGIPFGYDSDMNMSRLEMAVSVPNTGAKYDKGEGGVFKYAGGLHGAGLKCVNYISSEFMAFSKRADGFRSFLFREGLKVAEDIQSSEGFPYEHGTWIAFAPDRKVFTIDPRVNLSYMTRYLKGVSCLNAGLRIILQHRDTVYEYFEPDGTTTLLKEKSDGSEILFPIVGVRSEDSGVSRYEISFCVTEGSGESISSFVNGLEIDSSSDSVVAVRQSFARAVLKYIDTVYNPNSRSKVTGLETSDIRAGLCAVIKLLHVNPSFDSQTKTRLTNKDIGRHINDTLPHLIFIELQKNPSMADGVVRHISRQAEARRASEQARKKTLAIAKKMAEDTSNISLDIFTPPTKPEDVEQNMLCMFEGLSASSALVKASKFINPETSRPYKEHIGILALQGLVLQSLEVDMSRVLQNKELATLIKVSGLNPKDPSDLSNLRFGKFVITSDQDAGGAQICVQLVIFFATHFPEVVRRGMLYRLETPLFSVIDTRTREYTFCYNSDIHLLLEEMSVTEDDIYRGKYIVRRNKGLGELDDREVRTLVENPKLVRICPEDFDSLKKLLYIFSGKDNIQDRKGVLFRFGLGGDN